MTIIVLVREKSLYLWIPHFSVEGSAECFFSFNMHVLYCFPWSCCFTQEQLYLLMVDMKGVDPN